MQGKKKQLKEQLKNIPNSLKSYRQKSETVWYETVFTPEDIEAAAKIAKKSVEETKFKETTSRLEETKSGTKNVPILYQ